MWGKDPQWGRPGMPGVVPEDEGQRRREGPGWEAEREGGRAGAGAGAGAGGGGGGVAQRDGETERGALGRCGEGAGRGEGASTAPSLPTGTPSSGTAHLSTWAMGPYDGPYPGGMPPRGTPVCPRM